MWDSLYGFLNLSHSHAPVWTLECCSGRLECRGRESLLLVRLYYPLLLDSWGDMAGDLESWTCTALAVTE